MLHSPVLKDLNRLIGILHYNRCLLEDGLMGRQESDRMWFIVGKLWDLKLQIHMVEEECAQLSDAIGHVISLMLHLYLDHCLSMCAHICIRDDS